MILWLASYPRSGNTLLRTMLQQALGLHSYSVYDDKTDVGLIPEVREKTGHEFLDATFAEFYQREHHSPQLNLVKTHGPQTDASPAIYVIRDGRSAIVSWYNMLVRLRKRTDVTITDVILGRRVPYVDWSSHVRTWDPKSRPKTLLLYYHELLSKPEPALAAISEFLGRKRIAEWHNNFEEMHRLFPDFFYRGSDDVNIGQMTKDEQDLFWKVHGQCMQDFGYAHP